MKMIQTTIYLTLKQVKWLNAHCAGTNMVKAKVIRDAIAQYIKAKEGEKQ